MDISLEATEERERSDTPVFIIRWWWPPSLPNTDTGKLTQSVRPKIQAREVEVDLAPPVGIEVGYNRAWSALPHSQNADTRSEAWNHLRFNVSRRKDTLRVSVVSEASPRATSSKNHKVEKGGVLAQSTAESGVWEVYIPTEQPAVKQVERRQTTGESLTVSEQEGGFSQAWSCPHQPCLPLRFRLGTPSRPTGRFLLFILILLFSFLWLPTMRTVLFLPLATSKFRAQVNTQFK